MSPQNRSINALFAATSLMARILSDPSPRRRVRGRDVERLAPDEDRPGAGTEIDAGHAVELRPLIAAEVVEPGGAVEPIPVRARDDVDVVVGAGLHVDRLEADDVAAVGALVEPHGAHG